MSFWPLGKLLFREDEGEDDEGRHDSNFNKPREVQEAMTAMA